MRMWDRGSGDGETEGQEAKEMMIRYIDEGWGFRIIHYRQSLNKDRRGFLPDLRILFWFFFFFL